MADAARIVRAAEVAGLSGGVRLSSCYGGGFSIDELRGIARGDVPDKVRDFELGDLVPYRKAELIKNAKFLHCSTDYLLGLTDQLRPADAEPGQMTLAAWMPGGLTPPEPCEVVADVDVGDGVGLRRLLYWDGMAFRFKKGGVDIEVSVIRWLRLPEVEKEENDA